MTQENKPIERVRGFLAHAESVLERPSPSLVDALVAETGLSSENVRQSMTNVRTDEALADAAQISAFCAAAEARGSHGRVALVLSSNVFTAPIRAIAWALAQAPLVTVRASRRARSMLTLLANAPGLEVPNELPEEPAEAMEALVAELAAGDALHVYGGEVAISQARALLARRLEVDRELHGPGLGAIVARAIDVIASADAIAEDVAAYDQRGCLSPRLLVLVTDGMAGERVAAEALFQALDRVAETKPRGAMSDAERGDVARACDAATFVGTALVAPSHAVLLLGGARRVSAGPLVSPGGRVLPIVSVSDVAQGLELLRSLSRHLTVLGASPFAPGEVDQAAALGARIVRLGTMQRPPLSIGPVDGRTSTFT